MIRLSKSSIGDEEKKAVLEVLNNEYLGMGKYVEKFENQLSEFFGRTAVCVSSGTAALQLALQSLDLDNDDEVIVQSLTFIATYQAISATGANPVSCDINSKNISINLKDAERRLTDKTKVIVPVHYASDVGGLSEIYNFAKANGLRVVEDAAHAFGSIYKGRKIGSFGDIACFSLDGIKNITSGEGGVIVTSDEEVLQKVRDLRLLGVEKDTEKRFRGERSWTFDVKFQGWRYHMSNIMAAIGSEQIKRFSDIEKIRKKIINNYLKLLSSNKSIEPLDLDYTNIVSHLFVIKVKNGDRDHLRDYLMKNDIECGIHYYPNHLLSKYRTNYDLPITIDTFKRILSLPCHLDISSKDQEYIAIKIQDFFNGK